MARLLKGLMWTFVAIGVLAAAVLGELFLREQARERLTGVPEVNPTAFLTVEGTVKPDFLWTGEAWHLEVINSGPTAVTSCVPFFDSEADSGRAGPFTLLPGGRVLLYYNHDHANAPHVVPRKLTLRTAQGTFTWDIRRGP